MYTAYIVRRTQIYIEDDQDRRLEDRAEALGTTKSAVIRHAIDAFFASDRSHRADLARLRAAVAESSGALRELPSGAEYVEAIRSADVERERELRTRRGP